MVSRNRDAPEGGFDAILQAAVCKVTSVSFLYLSSYRGLYSSPIIQHPFEIILMRNHTFGSDGGESHCETTEPICLLIKSTRGDRQEVQSGAAA